MNILQDIFLLILSLAVPTLIGRRGLRMLWPNCNALSASEIFFLSYGLGFALVTLIMFGMSLAGLRFNGAWFTAIFTVVLWVTRKHHTSNRKEDRHPSILPLGIRSKSDPLAVFMLAFIAVNFLTVFLRTMTIDIDMWDSWAFWAFKAKIFYHHRSIPLGLFGQFKGVWGNWDYPQHVPLMETWIMLWTGSWNDLYPRIIFPIFYAGICVLGFSFLRRRLPIIPALAGTCLFASLSNLQIYTIGTIAEPVMLFYYLASFISLYEWGRSAEDRTLLLSAVLSGCALWTKGEAIVLVLGNFILLLYFILNTNPRVYRRGAGSILAYILVPALIIAPWNIFTTSAGIKNAAFNTGYFQAERIPQYLARLQRIPDVLSYHVLNFSHWNLLWLFLVAAFAYNIFVRKDRNTNLILTVITFQCVVYILGYITTPWADEVFIYDTMNRLILAPALLAIFYICLTCFHADHT